MKEVDASYVKKIAKYVWSRISGRTKLTFRPNESVIDMFLYYHTGRQEDPVEEVDIQLSLTAYSGKLRLNVINMSDNEKTLLHTTIDASGKEPEDIRSEIMESVRRALSKEYTEYDFIF